MRLEYHPRAKVDVTDAAVYYAAQSSSLGREFLQEVDVGVSAILANPTAWAVYRGATRVYLLSRFPYGIYYRLKAADTVQILVIKHHSRRPGYGMRRK